MKIYDCFTYFNEIELLELRLNLLHDVVDYFVVVEANKTHKNNQKDFNFEKNTALLQDYLAKIIYIKVEDMPDCPSNEWELENYQRNCITRGLTSSSPEDLILISDIDEIPAPAAIKLLTENNRSTELCTDDCRQNIEQLITVPENLLTQYGRGLLDITPLALEQTLYYYFVNCQCKEKWHGTTITKAKYLAIPQLFRNYRNVFPRISYGGWHFSYLGGIERILEKLNSIVESTANAYSADHIKHCISNGLDLYGRTGRAFEFDFIPIDQTLPHNIQAIIEKYPYLCFKESCGIRHPS